MDIPNMERPPLTDVFYGAEKEAPATVAKLLSQCRAYTQMKSVHPNKEKSLIPPVLSEIQPPVKVVPFAVPNRDGEDIYFIRAEKMIEGKLYAFWFFKNTCFLEREFLKALPEEAYLLIKKNSRN